MNTNSECESPFYVAYEKQVELINAIVDKAIEESAAKMGDTVSAIYSIAK